MSSFVHKMLHDIKLHELKGLLRVPEDEKIEDLPRNVINEGSFLITS